MPTIPLLKPQTATIGDDKVRDRILRERAVYAVIFLCGVLDDGTAVPPE